MANDPRYRLLDLKPEEKLILEQATSILDRAFKRGDVLSDPTQAGQFCKLKLQGYAHEVFAVLFLDSRHRIIAFEELFRGSIDGAEIHPREVVRRCLDHNAQAVILCHNHPSGVTEASAADRAITRRLGEALALIEVRILDHFIVGDGPALSFAEKGWL